MNDSIAVIVLASIAATAITVMRVARIFANRSRGGSSAEVTGLEERVARLEHTVEALSVDSGRLIDGQRFLSQLLTEKSAAQPVDRFDRP